MFVNAWLGIPEADHNELNNRRGTEDNVGPAAQFVDGQIDPDVVQNLYKVRTVGPNSWHLWSVILNDEDGPINQQINAFRTEFASAQVLGVWKPDGAMLGCQLVVTQVPNPEYVGEPFEIPNPAYDPDPESPTFDPRETIRNPAWVPEFINEVSQTGTPDYEPSDTLSQYMPDGELGPDPTLRDVNHVAGWAPRIFA
jgi:hypothetical protein